MLCIAGYDGYFKHLSPAWQRTLGYTDAELLAKPCLDFIHPDDRQRTIEAASRAADGDQVIEFKNRYLAKNGKYRWFSWSAVPDPGQQMAFCVARDITHLKRHEFPATTGCRTDGSYLSVFPQCFVLLKNEHVAARPMKVQ